MVCVCVCARCLRENPSATVVAQSPLSIVAAPSRMANMRPRGTHVFVGNVPTSSVDIVTFLLVVFIHIVSERRAR